MRDSIGSIYPLVIVFAFIILMSGFLAFSVNYNKAYKMKNQIIYILEKNENKVTDEAQEEIAEYAKSIGYSATSSYMRQCDATKYNGWCGNVVTSSNDSNGTKTNGSIKEYETTYVDVTTYVSIDVPIFNVIFPHIRLFSVKGSTKQITKVND